MDHTPFACFYIILQFSLSDSICTEHLFLPPKDSEKESLIRKKIGTNLKSDYMEFLCSLSGLEFCKVPPAQCYVPKTQYLKDNLPCEIGNPMRLDFRLLDGDLDDPNRESEVVRKVLQMYRDAENGAFVDVALLLAGAGFGKTKAIFDIAKSRYVTLLDASAVAQEDIQSMSRNIARLAEVIPADKVRTS
jgi:hypothetical protein